MIDRIWFEIRDLRREPAAAPEKFHFHCRLRIRLEDDLVEYLQPVCVNTWLAALVSLKREIALSDHGHDPVTFFIDGLEDWPVLEAIRMNDLLRVTILQGDEAVAKCLLPSIEFQQTVDKLQHRVFQKVQSVLGSDAPAISGELVRWKCNQFSMGKAGAGVPPWSGVLPHDPMRVICLRVDQMDGDSVAGSLRGRCSSCAADVLFAPSSQAIISEGAELVCLNCAARDKTRIDIDRLEKIARLKARAEAAYDAIYELHDDQQIARNVDSAESWLLSAAELERKAGLTMDAEATEKRAYHIRMVYRHQFMLPPDTHP